MFLQVANALCSAHGKKIAHWDIKPQNILIDLNDQAKLTDFGVLKHLKKGDFEATTTGVKGTLQFRAPELSRKVGDSSFLDLFACDMWALGVTIF